MNDVEQSLNKAEKVFKGPFGWLVKLFMGKKFVNTSMNSINTARQYAVNNPMMQQQLRATGSSGKATILKLEDTGTLINYNPVVRIQMKVTPDYGSPFETTVETQVSKIAIPRVGDVVNVKYNPTNTQEVAIV